MGWNSFGSYTKDCPHEYIGGSEIYKYDCFEE